MKTKLGHVMERKSIYSWLSYRVSHPRLWEASNEWTVCCDCERGGRGEGGEGGGEGEEMGVVSEGETIKVQ